MEQTIAAATLIISLATISISAANDTVDPPPADKAIIAQTQQTNLTAEEQTDYQFVRSNTTPTNPQPQEQTK